MRNHKLYKNVYLGKIRLMVIFVENSMLNSVGTRVHENSVGTRVHENSVGTSS
jgi:hypothetical protein